MMDEGQDRVRASYRGNYDRLARVKDRYDPDNVFHINQNIPPAPSPASGGRVPRVSECRAPAGAGPGAVGGASGPGT